MLPRGLLSRGGTSIPRGYLADETSAYCIANPSNTTTMQHATTRAHIYSQQVRLHRTNLAAIRHYSCSSNSNKKVVVISPGNDNKFTTALANGQFYNNKFDNSTSKLAKNFRRSLSYKQQEGDKQIDKFRMSKDQVRMLDTNQPLHPYVDPKYSYAFGRSASQLIYSTVSREIYRQIEETGGDKITFTSDYEGIEKNLRQFYIDISTLAKSLLTKFNLKKGDSVGVYSYNGYNWLVTQFACARLGLVLVPINPSYKAEELAFVLHSSRVKCLFTQGPKSIQRELNDHLACLQSNLIRDKLTSGQLSHLTDIVFMDGNKSDYQDQLLASPEYQIHEQCKLSHWQDCVQGGRIYTSLEEAEADESLVDKQGALIVDLDHVKPSDTFAVYYTSGTTGTPKGACVSHFSALNNALICANKVKFGHPDEWAPKMVTVLPYFHIYAGVLISFSIMATNASMIIPSYKYDIEATIKSMIRHQTNVTTVTPTILIDMMRYTKLHNLGQQIPLTLIQSGGDNLPGEMVNRAFEIFDKLETVRIGYGSTENAAVASMQSYLEPEETRACSVGPPIDFTECRIVKYDSDELVELGKRGEIQTRGHNCMQGYLNEPEKTSAVITQDGWYRTGDIGVMLANGSLQIVGRIKSLIIRGGENIYPDEVERFIYKLHYVDTVHVIGIPDKRSGEEVCAWIKLKPGFVETGKAGCEQDGQQEVSKEEIIGFCKQQMTYFKVPRYILFVDSFPMTPTKKVQAHVMTEMSIKLLNLTDNHQKSVL